MSSSSDHGSAAEQGGDEERAPAPTPASSTGDLEFDEAWGGAAAEADASPQGGGRDPDPSFEDPNDR